MTMRDWPALALLVALSMLLATGCASRSGLVPSTEQRQAADLTEPLQKLEGGQTSLSSFRGNVVLVHFFSSDCLPCLQEIGPLSDLYRELNEQGLEVVGVSLDLQGALTTSMFRERYGIPYPLVLASKRMFEGQTPFGPLAGLPSSVLLDRRGAVAGWVVGLMDPATVREAVERLLEE